MFDFDEVDQNKRNEQARKRSEDNALAAKIRSNIESLQGSARAYFFEKHVDVVIEASETQISFARNEFGMIEFTGLYGDKFTVNKAGTRKPARSYDATSQNPLTEAEVTRLIIDWVDGEV